MKHNQTTNLIPPLKLLLLLSVGLWCQPVLKADVVVLQTGGVLTGNILQQDASGVLIQLSYGTFRYPPSVIREVRKEAAAAPHVSNNGQNIPDWAQAVMMLAKNGWAQELKQVPATMVESGIWKNVPYISFTCASGGYELNIFGDLNKPAAVQIGAMTYLKQSAEARTNCVNFICSLLANSDDRKLVRALNWDQKDVRKGSDLTVENIMPGEWGSYGGWWISVYSEPALAAARASDAELLLLTQAAVPAPPTGVVTAPPPSATAVPAQPAAAAAPPAGQPAVAAPQLPPPTTQPAAQTTQPATAYYYEDPHWTADEMARARAVTPGPGPAVATPAAATPGKVYPRTYSREAGAYRPAEVRRR